MTHSPEFDLDVEPLLRGLFAAAGDDPERVDLLKTPARWKHAMEELLAGYRVDPRELLGSALFESPADQVVVVRRMPFVSVCEHHMLPFTGTAGVAYLPAGRIVGLSKIPRALRALSQRLQVQERLTQELADAVRDVLGAAGVLVVVDASHTCCELRGVRAAGTVMTTSCALGIFRDDPPARAEALLLLRG